MYIFNYFRSLYTSVFLLLYHEFGANAFFAHANVNFSVDLISNRLFMNFHNMLIYRQLWNIRFDVIIGWFRSAKQNQNQVQNIKSKPKQSRLKTDYVEAWKWIRLKSCLSSQWQRPYTLKVSKTREKIVSKVGILVTIYLSWGMA